MAPVVLPRPIRSTVVFHSAGRSGPARSLHPRIAWLAAHGSVTAVFPAPGPAESTYRALGPTCAAGYEPLTLPRSPVAWARAAGRSARDARFFSQAFRKTRPDVVLVVSAHLPAALVGARLAGCPAIVYAAEIFEKGFESRRSRTLGARLVVAATARLAAHVIACSETVAAQYRRRDVPVTTIYPGVALTGPSDRTAAREVLAVPADAVCLVVVGNLTAGRGQDVLVRAIPEIGARLQRRVVCLVAGAPDRRAVDLAYQKDLAWLVNRIGLDDQVRLLGTVDAVEDVYAAADVVVNPARFNEPFGRVAIEALAAGRPVVAARVGAIPEVLEHERDALLVAPDRPDALAAAVVRLVQDPALSRRLVEQGRARVSERFSEEKGVDAFGEVVRSVLELSRRRPRGAARRGAPSR